MSEKNRPRIAVDCDGVITCGGGPTPYEFAPLNPGVRQFLGALKDRGLEIIIHSARTPTSAVEMFFKKNDLHRFVDGYSRVKPVAKVYVDDRAVSFKGNFGETLDRIDEFRPWWDSPNKFSCLMAMLPEDLAKKVMEIGSKVPDADLAEDGREKEPHVTALYGITEDATESTRHALDKQEAPKITVGAIGMFEAADADVLHLKVDSPMLHAINAAMRKGVPHIETYPEYTPHITVAYCKKGTGKKYLGLDGLEGESCSIGRLVFSDRNNSRQEIILK